GPEGLKIFLTRLGLSLGIAAAVATGVVFFPAIIPVLLPVALIVMGVWVASTGWKILELNAKKEYQKLGNQLARTLEDIAIMAASFCTGSAVIADLRPAASAILAA